MKFPHEPFHLVTLSENSREFMKIHVQVLYILYIFKYWFLMVLLRNVCVKFKELEGGTD